MSRQKVLLAVLLTMFVLSIVYAFVRMPRQPTAPASPAPRGGISSGKEKKVPAPTAKKEPQVPADRMLPLDLDTAQYASLRRNIFRPIFREEARVAPLPPPPPAPPRRVETSRPSPSAADQQQSPKGGGASGGVKEEAEKKLGKLRFVGFLKNDARKIIFLAEGNELFLVKKGDRIAGKYEVKRLTDDAVTITVLADGSDLVFPLVENRSLSLAKP